jgi:orotidine-5'-phosphate decarboxylase
VLRLDKASTGCIRCDAPYSEASVLNEAPASRLILALDGLEAATDALRLVEDLDGIVSFYKVGWELFMAGHWLEVVRELSARKKRVFLDLKLPGDIPATIESAVRRVSEHPAVELMTLSGGIPRQAVAAARNGRGGRAHPKLLSVPYVSSLDASDLADVAGSGHRLDDFILERSSAALDAGCDGLIASGDAIALLRRRFPWAILVSPGIRPVGSSTDDHKRSTTPAEAIRMGADYLVVGRPIRSPKTRVERRAVAEAIVADITSANAR